MWSYKNVIEREHPPESLVNMNNFIVICSTERSVFNSGIVTRVSLGLKHKLTVFFKPTCTMYTLTKIVEHDLHTFNKHEQFYSYLSQ
jgi:hypothetical protein